MKFNASIIATLLTAIIKLIDAQMLRKWLLAAIDKLEEVVKESPNEYDDAILPLINAVRNMLSGE